MMICFKAVLRIPDPEPKTKMHLHMYLLICHINKISALFASQNTVPSISGKVSHFGQRGLGETRTSFIPVDDVCGSVFEVLGHLLSQSILSEKNAGTVLLIFSIKNFSHEQPPPVRGTSQILSSGGALSMVHPSPSL